MDAALSALPQSRLRFADLGTGRATPFALTPTPAERAEIAKALGIVGIKKLHFSGDLAPQSAKDWTLKATLGATVVQDCVVTLDPVTTRIDEAVLRTYLSELEAVEAAEIEMPEDESVEELPTELDLANVMIEALTLALPLYPKVEGATLAQAVFTKDGTDPMTDEDARPFAGLGALRDKLENKQEK